MKKRSRLLEISFELAVISAQFIRIFSDETKDYVLCRQFLKSSTSIGANIEEAFGAESRNDFKHKLSIAYKEARETDYWVRLLSRLYPEYTAHLRKVESLNQQILKMTYSGIRTVALKSPKQ